MMEFGHDEACLAHETGAMHPESADRVAALVEAFRDADDAVVRSTEPLAEATATLVHERDYLDDLAAFADGGGGDWGGDTVGSGATYEAALASAGAARWAVDRALDRSGDGPVPFGLCRPPGHHALTDDAMGFCFLNNAAIATEVALREPGVDRVAVVDWDVHHGNGIEAAFRGREDVLYASVHEQGLFPATGADDDDATTLNLPLPSGAGDREYVAAVENWVAPRVERFDPDLVVVAAGFDASDRDRTSAASVTPAGYAHLTAAARRMAGEVGAALAFLLEGGYHLGALVDGVRAVAATVAGRDLPHIGGTAPEPEGSLRAPSAASPAP